MGRKEGIPDRQYTQEFKIEAVRLSESIGGNQAAKRLGIPDSSIWNWIRLSRAGKLKGTDGSAAPIKWPPTELEAENARLRRELAEAKLDLEVVKKSGGVFREGVAVKYTWIEEHRDQFAITRMCRLLAVSRTGYCQWRGRAPSERSIANSVLDAKVAAIHSETGRSYGGHGSFGSCRMKARMSVMSAFVKAFNASNCALCIVGLTV